MNVPTDEILPTGPTNGEVAQDGAVVEGEEDMLESERLKKNIIFPPPEIRSEFSRSFACSAASLYLY